LVAEKFQQALLEGLTPILCIGETLVQRESDQTESVLREQLDAVIALVGIEAMHKAVVAYEPVWAIGTGRAATPEQAQAVHAFLRKHLEKQDAALAKKLLILYGGSVNAENAKALFSMPDIDGGLIGGASLKPELFASIVNA
jgi:triosephosphate isomerase